jgi:hypothetical protein
VFRGSIGPFVESTSTQIRITSPDTRAFNVDRPSCVSTGDNGNAVPRRVIQAPLVLPAVASAPYSFSNCDRISRRLVVLALGNEKSASAFRFDAIRIESHYAGTRYLLSQG